MRILIDALSARVGGGVTYIEHIMPALARLNTEHEIFIVLSPLYQQNLIDQAPAGVTVIPVTLPPTPLLIRWWYLQTGLVRLLRKHHIDVFFAPAESSYLRIPTTFVMLARNLSIYASPNSFGKQSLQLIKYRLGRQLWVFLSLHRADRVLFVSNTFREQVVRQMRLALAKTEVVYHGISEVFFEPAPVPEQFLRHQPYVLTVSSINPHKNIETLLRAYAKLPIHAPKLLIAGGVLDDTTYNALQAIIRQHGLEERVVFLGRVAYNLLPALYQGALASVMPSRLETFGHPMVEAMASGTPLIASDLPVCREICEAACLYFPVDDDESLADYLYQLWADPGLRTRLEEAGRKRAKNFSWEQSARQLLNVFENMQMK